ncbi:MAG: tetratricopeptide repeat protein, partial [Trichodesmium sp. St19_bin1]|nr:tetratricopeptide repeat protein [Trichodesmium sp. St19_bin1]
MIVIIVINGLEVLVMRPGRADDFVLSQQPSTLEATGELIINGTLNENSEQFEHDGSYFQLHTFTGKAGDVISIELNSSEFDAYLMLIDATKLHLNASELYKQGKYDEAVPLLEQSLKMMQQVLGAEHPYIASSLNSLALLYNAQGRYTEAEPLYIQALEIFKKLLGAEHPSVATSLNNLARLYYAQRSYTEAEPLYIQSLEMRKKLLGAEHPSVAESLNNLAGLYQAQGRYTEAEPLYIRALEMDKKLLGAEHPDVATSLNNLAALYSAKGNIASAVQYLERGLEVEEKNLTYNLVAGAEPQKDKYLETISGTKNGAISLHLQTAPNNPAATTLALRTILRSKGRLLQFLTASRKILRQQLDPQGLQWLDEL